MSIILDLYLWFKGWFGTLKNIKQFEFMCLEFDRSGGKKYRNTLSRYLSRKSPYTGEINTIYSRSSELQWLYLEQMSYRDITEYEESRLVTAMPMGKYYRFPYPLHEEGLKLIFSLHNSKKLEIYLQDFLVPEEFEVKLLEFCNKHKSMFDKLLDAYLENKGSEKGQPFTSAETQDMFLSLATDEQLCKWLECLTFEHNFLTENSITYLINHGNEKVMNTFLANSYLPSKELQHKVLEKYPKLKWELEISKLRRPLYLIERQKGYIISADIPSDDELLFIEDTLDTIDSLQDKELYERERMMYRLQIASPALCGWIAFKFPSLGQNAYKRVRRIAEIYN